MSLKAASHSATHTLMTVAAMQGAVRPIGSNFKVLCFAQGHFKSQSHNLNVITIWPTVETKYIKYIEETLEHTIKPSVLG